MRKRIMEMRELSTALGNEIEAPKAANVSERPRTRACVDNDLATRTMPERGKVCLANCTVVRELIGYAERIYSPEKNMRSEAEVG